MKLAETWQKAKRAGRGKALLTLAVVAMGVVAPVLTNQYFDGHDTEYHAQSIVGLEKDNTIIGIFNTQIFEEMNRDFGYGEGWFYPQLSHHVAAVILHVIKPLGGDVLDAMRATHLLTFFLSGLFMYLLMRRVLKGETAAILSAVLYMTFPYHVGDFMVRDAFAELWVFVFLPIVFLSLQELLEKNWRKFFLLFVVGMAGMLNSHLVLTMYLAGFLFVISLFFWREVYNKETLKRLVGAGVATGLIVAPLLVSVVQGRLDHGYVVLSGNFVMFTPAGINNSRVNLPEFFATEMGEADVHKDVPMWLNVVLLILAILAIYNYARIKRKRNKLILVSGVVMAALGLFGASSLMPWTRVPGIFYHLQFAWRLELFAGFGMCLLAGLALKYYKVEKDIALMMVVAISCVWSATSVQTAQTNWNLVIDAYECVDYYPMEMFENQEYYQARGREVAVLSGGAEIADLAEHGRDGLEFEAYSPEGAKVELPRIYYLGYKVTAEQDGKVEELEYSAGENGFITVDLPADYHKVKLEFVGTGAVWAARGVSALTMVALAGAYIAYGLSGQKRGKSGIIKV